MERIGNSNNGSVEKSQYARFLSTVRREASTMLEYGATLGAVSSLIALAGLVYWCPRCGEWMGEGSEGSGSGVPNPAAPKVPARLLRAVSSPMQSTPTPLHELPSRDGARLTSTSGVLETQGMRDGSPAKIRHNPPSDAHGRKVDTYTGGSPNPDSRPHAHLAQFVRGDGEVLDLYEREVNGNIVHDTGVSVTYQAQDNSYVWRPKGQRSNEV